MAGAESQGESPLSEGVGAAASDQGFQHGQVRNEYIAFPAYVPAFLEQRSAARDEELAQENADELPLLKDEEVEERAAITRRLLEKLGILSEVEELRKFDQERNRRDKR